MNMQQETYANRGQAIRAAIKLAIQWLELGWSPVVVAESRGAVDALRRECVRQAAASPNSRGMLGTLGITVTTYEDWLADQWELFGDGRRPVDAAIRKLLISRHLQRHVFRCAPSVGTVDLFARLAQDHLPQIAGISVATASACGMTSAESKALMALNSYASDLLKLGLVEPAQMLEDLPDPGNHLAFVWLPGDDPSYCEQRAMQGLSRAHQVACFDDGCLAADAPDGQGADELASLLSALPLEGKETRGLTVEPQGQVRVLLPAGRYAVVRQLADTIAQCRAEGFEGPIAIASCDPLTLHADLAPLMRAQGQDCAVEGVRAFDQTVVGRAFLSLWETASAVRPFSVAQASDYALSPVSGISASQGQALNKQWRQARNVTRVQVLDDLIDASECAARQISLMGGGLFAEAMADMVAMVRKNLASNPCEVALAVRAETLVERWIQAADVTGSSIEAVMGLMAAQPVSCAVGSQAPVAITAMAALAAYPARSFDVVILCGLTADNMCVKPADDVCTAMREKLGLKPEDNGLHVLRRRFFHSIETAASRLYVQRVQNDETVSPAYSAVILGELLDCYIPDVTNKSLLDEATGMPACMPVELLGEDALQANLARVPLVRVHEAKAPSLELSRSHWPLTVPLTAGGEGNAPVLSPSSVENYLECPYKWFVNRRLRVQEIDAGFGPLEMGSFVHEVLKKLFESLKSAGKARLTLDTLSDALRLADQIFAETLKAQPYRKASDNPLVPLTQEELIEVERLRRNVLAFVQSQVDFLPQFTPRHFEVPFAPEDNVRYAGAVMRGSVDRIDVDDRGNAVIVDYKGSLTGAYELRRVSPVAGASVDGDPAAPDLVLPQKMQTLIYASMVQQRFGYNVVGALYVGYGKKRGVSGAFDGRYLGEEDMPGIKSANCCVQLAHPFAPLDFPQLVTYCESGVARAVQSLVNGDIAPAPRDGAVCKYCHALSCPKRMEG